MIKRDYYSGFEPWHEFLKGAVYTVVSLGLIAIVCLVGLMLR